MLLVDVASKSPTIGRYLTTVRARKLSVLHVFGLYVLLHVLLSLAYMRTVSTSELIPTNRHNLDIHSLDILSTSYKMEIWSNISLNKNCYGARHSLGNQVGINNHFEFLCFLET